MNDLSQHLAKGTVFGVDIGGTHIRAGLVNQNGEIQGEAVSFPTLGHESPDAIIRRITDAITFIYDKMDSSAGNLLGIGLGVTGPLDLKKGLILECPQLPTLHYYPLVEKIAGHFGIPVIMNNDANAMILGESIFGAGKGSPTVLGFTLGTGLGCAIVVNQELQTGARELAGEIWSSPYKEATIEDYVSGRGIQDSYLHVSGRKLQAIEISKLASSGDNYAIRAFEEFGTALGFALAWTINLVDPDAVILGGSIANSVNLFNTSMMAMLTKYACPSPSGLPPIYTASLGSNSGVIGAAALVFVTKQTK